MATSKIDENDFNEELSGEIGDVYEEITQLKINVNDLQLNQMDRTEIINEVTNQLDASKADIVQQVINAMEGLPVFGTVDSDNTITVTSTLADGKYVLKYENDEGVLTEIGTIVIGDGEVEVTFTNLVPTSLDLDGEGIYNEIGYKNGAYCSMTSAGTPSTDGTDSTTVATGIIPYTNADTQKNYDYYIKGVTIDTSKSHCRCQFIDSNYNTMVQLSGTTFSDTFTIEELGDMYYKLITKETNGNRPYARFSFIGTGENLIISTTPIE